MLTRCYWKDYSTNIADAWDMVYGKCLAADPELIKSQREHNAERSAEGSKTIINIEQETQS